MALLNTTTPAAYSFSKNFIPLQFTSDNYLEQTGVASVNRLTVFAAVAAGSVITIKFGNIELTFTAAAVPDDSGLQFPTGDGSLAYMQSLIPYFKANHTIDTNYTVTWFNNAIRFTARKKTTGFDFSTLAFGAFGDIGNDITGVPSIARTNYNIHFELFCQNDDHSDFVKIHEGDIPCANGLISVDVSDRLDSYLEKNVLDIPDTGNTTPMECKKSCRKFYYTYAESWGQPVAIKKKYTSAQYTVISGGLSTKGAFVNAISALFVPDVADRTKDRFLKQGNSNQYTRTDQPQFLYFFNTRANTDARFMVRFYFTDATQSNDIIVDNFTLDTLSKYAFNVTYDALFTPADFPAKIVERYQVWIETSVGVMISEARTYWVSYKAQQYVRYFLSWSSWGAMDTRLCYGQATSSLELVQQEAKRIRKSGDDIKKGDSSIFDVKLINKFKVSTGHFSRTEMIFNRDFFLSPHKFRYSGGLFLPVKVTSKDIPELKDGETLFYQQFEYEYRFEDHVFTEGDVEEPGLGFESFFFNAINPLLPSNGLIETDPTVPSWVKAITQANINRWNTFDIAGYNKANWDNAFSWGNHALVGYALATNHYDKTTSDARYIQNRYDLQAGAKLNVYGGKFNNYLVVPSVEPNVADLEPGEWAFWMSETGGTPVLPPVIANLSDLGDVAIASLLNDQLLRYNASTGKWYNWTPDFSTSGGVSSWNDLTDKPTTLSGFGIQAEADGRYLGINGTAVNSTGWNGQQYSNTDNTAAAFMTYHDGQWGYSSISNVKESLGLGSAAYLNASQSSVASTVIQRDVNGYAFANYFNVGAQGADTLSPMYLVGSRDSDGYYRYYTAGFVQTFLGLGSAAYLNAVTDASINSVVGTNSEGSTALNDLYLVSKSGLLSTLLDAKVNSSALGSNAFSSTAYLPLTGGILTGGLEATSLSTNSTSINPFSITTTNTNGFYTEYQSNGTPRGYIGTGNNLFVGGSLTSFGITGASGHGLQFGTANTLRYTIDASGYNIWTGSGTFGGYLNANTFYQLAAWDFLNYSGTQLKFGGVSASQWQSLAFYTNNTLRATLTGTFALEVPLTGTSATFGDANMQTWSNNSAFARFGHKDHPITYYGYLQQSDGSIYLKGPSVNVDAPLNGTSATFSGNLVGLSAGFSGKISADGLNLNYGGPRTIWANGFGGAIQLLSDNATATRWARMGIVDSTGAWLGGMTIDNSTTATFSGQIVADAAIYSPILRIYGTEGYRHYQNNAYMSFYNTADNSRTGYIQFNYGGTIDFSSEAATGFRFLADGGLARLTIANSGYATFYGHAAMGGGTNGNSSYTDSTLELREAGFGGSNNTPPRLSFHWSGVVASQIGIESNGRIAILNNPGTGYESLVASSLTATASVYAPRIEASTLFSIPNTEPVLADMTAGKWYMWIAA